MSNPICPLFNVFYKALTSFTAELGGIASKSTLLFETLQSLKETEVGCNQQ